MGTKQKALDAFLLPLMAVYVNVKRGYKENYYWSGFSEAAGYRQGIIDNVKGCADHDT